MKKVLLTKEQAEALEGAVKSSGIYDKNISEIVSWKVTDLFAGEQEALNQLDVDTLCKALYVGYEVEPGPEEKLLDFYRSLNTSREFSAEWHIAVAVTKTLNLLNIKIKGINC